ncbi:hypothetical protein [Rhizobium sp. NZLR11]|uniref:hypothetical protein n=1 Tax=Rhizobium sp. NZLR11 TaxID=2731098 RepID=UPI00287FD98C|nr:hypothetical protein [Rhizobium sp. NZLR11]
MAQDQGHDCFHVNWLGLRGETDWDLMPRIVEEDFHLRDEQRARLQKTLRKRGVARRPCHHRSPGSTCIAAGTVLGRSARTRHLPRHRE